MRVSSAFRPNRWVALLTDFGLQDPYVAVMKAVILQQAPEARFVDITHEVAPQNVLQGAWMLKRVVRFFPSGTVFVAVVDPGVGTGRRNLVLLTPEFAFVGPDNGLFTWVAHHQGTQAFAVPTPPQASATFHGRDVYAPVAARLLTGPVPDPSWQPLDPTSRVQLAVPPVTVRGNRARAVILFFDRFGNAITNVEREAWPDLCVEAVRIDGRWVPLHRTYADVAPGEPLALWGSFGELEISVREGNAQNLLGLRPLQPIELILC